MTTINLSQQERELVEFVWNNRNTPWFFTVVYRMCREIIPLGKLLYVSLRIIN